MAGEPWRRQPKTAKRGWQCAGGDSAQDSERASKAGCLHTYEEAVVTVGGLGGKAGGGHTGGGVEGGSAGGGGGGEGGTICTTR